MLMTMVMLTLPMVTMRENAKTSRASHTRVDDTTTPAGEAATQNVGVWVTHVLVIANPSATGSAEGVGVWVTRAGETATPMKFGDPCLGVWVTHANEKTKTSGATVMHRHEL